MANKEHKLLAKYDWDIFYVNYSLDGHYQMIGVNEDASTKVAITDVTQLTQALNPKMTADELVASHVIRCSSIYIDIYPVCI